MKTYPFRFKRATYLVHHARIYYILHRFYDADDGAPHYHLMEPKTLQFMVVRAEMVDADYLPIKPERKTKKPA